MSAFKGLVWSINIKWLPLGYDHFKFYMKQERELLSMNFKGNI